MVRTKRSVALILLAAGMLAVGCSNGGDDDDVASLDGSEGDSESADSDKEAQEKKLYDWVDCMQEEGIPIGDPTRDADGNLVITDGPVQIGSGGAGAGVEEGEGADEPEFTPEEMRKAEETCGPPPPLGAVRDDLSEDEIAEMQKNALAFAKCMRDDGGIADFPDPDFSENGPGGAPATNSNGPGSEGGDGGDGGDGGPKEVIAGPFGEIDLSDPEMKAAFETCSDELGEGAGLPQPGGPEGENDT
jgi:hypothetical protein